MEKIEHVIAISIEALLSVIPALNHMQGDSREEKARLSGHFRQTHPGHLALTEIGL
jgi:hypothetical protein